MLTSADEMFAGFGPSAFLPRRRAVQSLDIARDRRELRRQLRAACPAEPGVYGMIDHAGRLIYVGVSRHLRQRLVTYFQGADSFENAARRDDHAAEGTAHLAAVRSGSSGRLRATSCSRCCASTS